MSYILDALRRADSERERERSVVPGLHAQAVPTGAPDADGDAPSHPWKWPIATAFIALLGLVGWLWFDRAEAPFAPAPAALAPLPAPGPVTPAVNAAPTAAAAPMAAAPAAPTAPAATTPAPTITANPPLAPPTSASAVAARKPPGPAMQRAQDTNSLASGATVRATPSATAPKPAPKTSEPEVKISPLAELPDDVRRELPVITVGGSIYSKSAASRMLVINGQVFHEGDELAGGLVLEQIRQKSAVLKFKTWRYEITY